MYWSKSDEDINQYIRTCLICSKSKFQRFTYGKLQPLEGSTGRWLVLAIDLVSGLPPCGEANRILVVIDRYTKQAHLLLCMKSFTVANMIYLLGSRMFVIIM